MSEGDEARVVKYHFESVAFAGVELPVGHVHLIEALNEPYHLRVAIAFRDPDADVELLLGQSCALTIARSEGAPRRVCGIAREVTMGERAHTAPIAELQIVPALSYLSLRRNTRIFQDKTVPEILGIVLSEGLEPYGRAATQELPGAHPIREYCVQYQESDLDFVHRLMEEEGFSYAFEHEGDVEQLVLRKGNGSFPAVPSGELIQYNPHNMEIEGAEPIARFERRHRPRTTSVVTRDWDWTRVGEMNLAAESRGEGTDERDREAYEHGRRRSLTISSYEQGVRKYQKEDGPAQAETRKLAHGFDAVVGVGVSRVVALAPGQALELSGHPSVGMDDRYLVTRVEHFSRPIGEAVPGGGSTDPYYNRFECIPKDVEYRPERRTEKPRISGIQTAVVTGPGEEEIHVDEHGRIRIQFHWDREGTSDEKSTCWVRVQQPWAGAGWGFWWVPRVKMEVAVHFIDGDPDRPLVTASLYNGSHPTPYTLPADKTKSTIKSNSSLGGGGFNELRFEDLSGSEEIYTHAQKDYNEVVLNDHNTLVHHDQTNRVQNDQTQIVHANQRETVNVNQTMTVDANRTVVVHGDFDETVDGTETRHTAGDVSETFDANEIRDIGASVTETVNGNETRDISGDQDETILASHTMSITGSSSETVDGSWSRTTVGGITELTPASYEITTAGGYTATAAAGITIIALGGVKLVGGGGVKRVDYKWSWLGGDEMKVGLNSMGHFAVKFGLCNNAFAGIGMKVEDTGLTVNFKAVDMTNKGTQLCFETTKMRVCGAHIDSAQDVKTP